MKAAELIRQIESEGCLVDAGNGILNIQQGSRLSADTVEEVKQEKEAIISLLENDQQAQAAGLNVALHGEMYWLSVSSWASLYMERTEGTDEEWTLWQENHRAMYRKHNVKAAGTFEEVLNQAANYIRFLKRKVHEDEMRKTHSTA